MLDSRDRNTGALFAVDLASRREEARWPRTTKADVGEVIAHPTEKTIQAVGFTYARREWTILDPAIKPDLDYLAKVEDGELVVTSRTLDDKTVDRRLPARQRPGEVLPLRPRRPRRRPSCSPTATTSKASRW